jgi:hypothetical protein
MSSLNNINFTYGNNSAYGNSPKAFKLNNGTSYNFNFYNLFYETKNDSFYCDGSNFNRTVYLDKLGLTAQEHQWLKATYLLQNVQGMDILPTNNTCLNEYQLKHIYESEICIDLSCNNITLKQEIVNCPYGCASQLNQYGDGCLQPTYILDILVIIAIIIIIVVGYIIKRKK